MRPQGIDPFHHKDLFGGTGEVQVWNLLGQRTAPPFDAVLACELEPDGSVGTHVQQHAHEVVVVVTGEGSAQVEGITQMLEPGSVVWLPKGHRLALQNASADNPLNYLIVKARTPSP